MDTPDYLYHYTSQTGLLGILGINNSKPSLWMTDILYLNDSSEYIHTLDLVKKEVKEHINKLPLQKGLMNIKIDPEEEVNNMIFDTYQRIESFCDDIRNDERFHIYVFSLSEKENDLSQWRSYCPQEGGFCIEFDYKILKSILDRHFGCDIEKCQYDYTVKQEYVNDIFKFIESSIKSDKKKSQKDIFIQSIIRITQLSSYIKHDSFREEIEHRIIHSGFDQKGRKYRLGKSMITPYIELSPVDNDNKLPISKIWIGPTPHPDLSRMSVMNMTKDLGYDIEIVVSETPNRTW